MKPTLAELDAETRLLGSLVTALVDDSVLNAARPETRRPRCRIPFPQHAPQVERDARKALPTDAPICRTCGERIPLLREGEPCPSCYGDPL